MEKKITKEYLDLLYNKLSKPLTCGKPDSNGIIRQKSNSEWSFERIFITSDEILKDEPFIIHRSYFDTDQSWKDAIIQCLKTERAFKHPVLSMYCLNEICHSVRQMNFNLNLI